MNHTVRLILGDQLNPDHSWYSNLDPNIVYVMIESWDEATYVQHHIQKIVGIFSAMRRFANHLESEGHQIIYRDILKTGKSSIKDELISICVQIEVTNIEFQQPDEVRLHQNLKSIQE